VGAAFGPAQSFLLPRLAPVGVDQHDEVVGERPQLGGVELPGSGPDLSHGGGPLIRAEVAGQGRDRGGADDCLLHRDVPGAGVLGQGCGHRVRGCGGQGGGGGDHPAGLTRDDVQQSRQPHPVGGGAGIPGPVAPFGLPDQLQRPHPEPVPGADQPGQQRIDLPVTEGPQRRLTQLVQVRDDPTEHPLHGVQPLGTGVEGHATDRTDHH